MKQAKLKTVTLGQVTDMLKSTKSSITQAPIMHDIRDRINSYIEDGKRPLYVYCHTTGKKCGMTAIAYFEKKLAQYDNDIIKLMTQYRGRGLTSGRAPKSKTVDTSATTHVTNRGQFVSIGTTVHKTDKKGEPLIMRTEMVLRDGGTVVRDYDVNTGEYIYIKGNAKMLTA